MRWVCCTGATAAASLALALEFAQPVAACTFVLLYPNAVPTDPLEVGSDRSPPRLLSVDYRVDPVEDELRASCGIPDTLTLDIQAEDDRTPREALRYRSEGIGGEDARRFDYPDPVDGVWFFLGADEPMDARIRVWVIDAAGNESEPLDVVLRDGPSGGCDVAPAPEPPAWPWPGALGAGLGLLWVWRRRLTPLERV